MAKQSGMSTMQLLVMFLLSVAAVVFASLYFDANNKNKALKQEVSRLEASQVLLMVPDEHAQDIANWLASHPEQTQSIIKMSEQPEQPLVAIGPAVNESTPLPEAQQNQVDSTTNEPVVVSEDENGVKVIRLPHGGIRVTTREQKENNN